MSDRLLHRCHELLIDPLGAALTNEPRLVIVPDSDLYALPFAALRDTNGCHMIERHTLRIANSAGLTRSLKQSCKPHVLTCAQRPLWGVQAL